MSTEFYLKDGVFGPHDTLAQPENVVRTTAQSLSEPQKAQVRINIGITAGGSSAVVASDITDSSVSGRAVMTGTPAASRAALGLATVASTGAYSNLTGVPAPIAALRYDVVQSLNGIQQYQVLENAGAASQYNLSVESAFRAQADSDIRDSLGTASALDVAVSGNATSTQVVKGNDTRLSAGGGGGMAIGSAITGATANKALYADASNNLAQASITFGRSDTDMYVPVQSNKASALLGGMTVQSFSTSDAFVAANVIYNGGSGGFIRVAYGSGSIVRLSGNEVHVSHFGNDTGGSVASPVTSARFDSAGLEIYGRVIAQKIRTTSYTLAALNSAIPSPTVGDRSFITDETTGAFRGACVGGGAISTPVYYDGAWRNG